MYVDDGGQNSSTASSQSRWSELCTANAIAIYKRLNGLTRIGASRSYWPFLTFAVAEQSLPNPLQHQVSYPRTVQAAAIETTVEPISTDPPNRNSTVLTFSPYCRGLNEPPRGLDKYSPIGLQCILVVTILGSFHTVSPWLRIVVVCRPYSQCIGSIRTYIEAKGYLRTL